MTDKVNPPKWLGPVKMSVFAMTAFLLIGFVVLVVGIVNKFSALSPEPLQENTAITLKLPPGCQIADADTTPSGNLLVRSRGPINSGCQRVYVIDVKTGAIRTTLTAVEQQSP